MNCSSRIQEDSLDNRDFKTVLDSLWFPWHLAQYLKKNADGFCYMAVMDSDMLFVAPLVVGRTKSGLTRLNCGIVLVNLHDVLKARRFMSKWAHVSHQLLTAGEGSKGKSDGSIWTQWQEQLEDDFRGNDQAGLVLLACGYDTANLGFLLGWGPGACELCTRPVEMQLGLFENEEPLPIRFRALPARILNHPESMVDGVFPPGLRILHLKGLWWRMALSKGVLFWDATRRPDWHRDALALQKLVSETWQMALNPEDRLVTEPLSVIDDAGTNRTADYKTSNVYLSGGD